MTSNGNVLDWNTAKWNVTNMEEFDTDLKSLCQHQSSVELFLLPGSMTAINAHQVCLQLDGDINVVKSPEDLEHVSSLLNSTKSSVCSFPAGI